MIPESSNNSAALENGWVRPVAFALKALSILGIIAVIAVIGGHQFAGKLKIVKNIQYIGHSDDAAYAAAGESLANGDGLDVRYVSEFFIKYPPGITRREDHWPPFMGFCIAPFFYFWGKAAWVAKIPPMLIGSVGLPFATALLAYALSRRGYVAIVAGLLMMLNSEMYASSLETLCDVATAMLIAAFCGSVIMAQRRPWMHLFAGFFLACAYFAKGSQVILLAFYPLMAVLAAGPRVLMRKSLWAGIGIALFLMAPYWYGNYRAYGNPFHSVQNYISGYYGLSGNWEVNTYFPYWGNDLPKTSDRWDKYGSIFWDEAAEAREEVARFGITGNDASPEFWLDYGKYGIWFRDWLLPARVVRASNQGTFSPIDLLNRAITGPPIAPEPQIKPLNKWLYPETEIPAACTALLICALLAVFPIQVGIASWKALRRRQRGAAAPQSPAANSTVRPPWMIGPVLALLLLLVIEGGFVAYLWQVQFRFCYLFVPILAAIGCTAASRFIEWPINGIGLTLYAIWRWIFDRRKPRTQNRFSFVLPLARQWHAIITIVVATAFLIKSQPIEASIDKSLKLKLNGSGFPFSDELDYPRVGTWIGKNLPNAVIMCRNPWELVFYASPHNKAIALPTPKKAGQAGADQILAIARYYGVTHFYMDRVRDQLVPYITGKDNAFKRVPGVPGLTLYEIDWSKIPFKTPEEALNAK